MRYDLRAIMLRTRRPRRKEIVFREIKPTAVLAGDLYAAAGKPIIDIWTAAIPRIVAEYERTLGEMTQDAPADVSAVISAVESDVARLLLTIRLRLDRWATRVEGYQRGKWRSAVLSATTVDIDQLIGPNDARMTVAASIERNVGLVKSVSDQARDRISEEVFQGLRERRPAREVAARIREKVDMGKRRALGIAADQNVKITAQLNDERRRDAGISTWIWRSSHKVHFRPEHARRDGKRYDDDATSGEHKPPEDRPGEPIHCGCTSQACLTLTGEF